MHVAVSDGESAHLAGNHEFRREEASMTMCVINLSGLRRSANVGNVLNQNRLPCRYKPSDQKASTRSLRAVPSTDTNWWVLVLCV